MMVAVATKKRGENTRGRTYPLPQWWRDLARTTIDRDFGGQKKFAESLETEPSYVNRVLTNETPTLALVERMCACLKIPTPFVVAASYEEAIAIDEARRIHRIKRNVGTEFLGIMTGVADSISEDQTATVEPVHASSDGRRGKPR
jgi:transcriptional regulator with XRE-family HTH domain